MLNPIVAKFLENNRMKEDSYAIQPSFELGELIGKALSSNKMKAVYHFDKKDGTLIFDKVLGRDENDDFYNEKNGNLETRKEEIKKVIVTVLLAEYAK